MLDVSIWVNELTLEELLRNLRKTKKQTITVAANAVGISPSYLSYIETGEREPSLTIIKNLAKNYGTSLEEIFRVLKW